MDTRLVDYDYAPELSIFNVGQTLCVVAAPVSLDLEQQVHRLATIPQGQRFRFAGKLEMGKASHTLLRAKVKQSGAFPLLPCDHCTTVLSHEHCTWSQGRDVIELCSGPGALGQGAIAAQFVPRVAVEMRPKLADLYRKNSSATVIEGDITEFDTICKIYDVHKSSATITSGVSCQPYSRLGDGRSGLDPRAQTLPATLATAHYLRAVAVILECVEPAGTDAYVRWQVDQFCKRTRFFRAETTLHLHDIWPCRRSRWWCVLTAPAIGAIELRPFPSLPDLPTIRHVLSAGIQWDEGDEKKLGLTATEIEAFGGVSGSPDQYLLNMSGQMPCALHAWGITVRPMSVWL